MFEMAWKPLGEDEMTDAHLNLGMAAYKAVVEEDDRETLQRTYPMILEDLGKGAGIQAELGETARRRWIGSTASKGVNGERGTWRHSTSTAWVVGC